MKYKERGGLLEHIPETVKDREYLKQEFHILYPFRSVMQVLSPRPVPLFPLFPLFPMCNGRGEIGGFINAESGYQTDPCPECSSLPSPPASKEKKP